jgi:hypothetical protein
MSMSPGLPLSAPGLATSTPLGPAGLANRGKERERKRKMGHRREGEIGGSDTKGGRGATGGRE